MKNLEEYVTNLKADLAKEIARREESEYRHSLVCEALDNLLEHRPKNAQERTDLRNAAYKALNGIGDE